MQDIEVDILKEPFPHLILYNFYDDKELKLIWEELNFYTKKDKLFEAKDYGGIPERTNSKAIWLALAKIMNNLAVSAPYFSIKY